MVCVFSLKWSQQASVHYGIRSLMRREPPGFDYSPKLIASKQTLNTRNVSRKNNNTGKKKNTTADVKKKHPLLSQCSASGAGKPNGAAGLGLHCSMKLPDDLQTLGWEGG